MHSRKKNKKQNFGFLQSRCSGSSRISKGPTSVNQHVAKQTKAVNAACVCVCEDDERHEYRQRWGRAVVLWGPEMTKGPEVWLFRFLNKTKRKNIYILQHIQKFLLGHRSLTLSSCHCKLGIVDIENNSFQHGLYIPLYFANVHTSIYRYVFFFPSVLLWKWMF